MLTSVRSLFRSAAALLLAILVVTCVDSTAPVASVHPSSGRASLALAFQFSSAARQAAPLYDLNGFTVDQVHVVVALGDTVLKDTTIAYAVSSGDVSLDLNINADPGAQLSYTLSYLSGTTVLYSGGGTATAFAVGTAPPANQTVATIVPVGPGATAAKITVSPGGGTFSTAVPIPFGATVTDANNVPIAGALLSWAVSDPTLASIGATTGLVTPTGKRGTLTVSVSTLDGVTGQTTIALVPPPAKLVVTSGGGQSGDAGSTLTQPLTVQLQAIDGTAASGQTVTFGASGGSGASASPASVTTDANGNAQATLVLGSTPGTYTFTATAGAITTSVTETANAGAAASLVLVSGDGQTDSTKKVLAAPLVVKATDKLGNPKSGVAVTWVRTSGTGTPSATATTTGADGTTSITYTLGTTVGVETVVASAAGVTTPVTFTLHTTTGGAATIAAVSGNGQTLAIGHTFSPLIVKVADNAGNPVTSAHVTWAVASGGGTLTSAQNATDATGQATATATTGSNTGPMVITATLDNGQNVQFGETVSAGLPSALRFTTNPANASGGGTITPAVQVSVLDASGNLSTLVSVAVTVTLAGGNSTATLSGTKTVSSVNGVATFSNLSVDKLATGYTLVATAGTLTTTSAPFTVGTSTASHIVLVGPSTYTIPAGTLPPGSNGIQVTDVTGAGVAGAPVMVGLPNFSGATFDTTLATDADGFITFTELAEGAPGIDKAGSGTFTFTNTGLQGSPVSIAVTVTPGAATGLQVANSPAPTAGSPFALVVDAVDTYGNVSTSTTGSVTVSVNTGPAGYTVTGILTQSLTAGVATFPNLSLNKAGGYLFHLASGSLSGSSGVIPVSAGAATQLGIVAPLPFFTTTSTTLPSVSIGLFDANGNSVSTAGVPITMSIASGTGTSGAVLSGSTATTSSAGVATFTSLSINLGGSGYELVASASGFPSVTGPAFTVTAAGPTRLVFLQQPQSVVAAGTAMSPIVSVELVDANSNLVTTATNAVTISVAPGFANPGEVVGGTTTVNAVNGIATFPGIFIDVSAGITELTATSPGLTSAFTGTFEVAPGAPASMQFMNFVTSPSPTAGATLSTFTVVVLDAFGNLASLTPGNVAISISSGPVGATVSGSGSQSVAAGTATFSNLSLNTAGTYTLKAVFGALSTFTSSFNVLAGAATQLRVVQQPPSSATLLTALSFSPIIEIDDALGNRTTSTDSIALQINPSSNPYGAGLTGARAMAVGGQAQFPNLLFAGNVGSALIIQATDVTTPATTSVSTSPVNVTYPGLPGFTVTATSPQLQFTTAGSTVTYTATLVDTNAAFPTSVIPNAFVTWSEAVGSGATLTPPSGAGITDPNGHVSITVTYPNAVAAQQIKIALNNGQSSYQFSVNTTTTAAGLSISQQPPAAGFSGTLLPTATQVQLVDVNNSPIAQSGVTVTAALATGSGTLAGTTTAITDATGKATFGILFISGLIGNYTLEFFSTGLTPAVSNTVVIGPGAATQLVFENAPNQCYFDEPCSGVVVLLEDAFGNPAVLSGPFNVTLSIASGPGALLTGAGPTATASGVAVFTLDFASSGDSPGSYTLTATAPGLTSVTSGAINVNAGQLIVRRR